MSLINALYRLAFSVERLATAIAPRRSFSVVWSVGPATSGKETPMPLNVELLDNQKIPVVAAPTDAGGVAVKDLFPGGLSWSSSDPTIASVTPNADGFSAVIGSPSVGNAVITVTGTASDGTVLEDAISVTVKPTAPSSLNLTAGVPELE